MKADTITAISAAAIALCALIVSVIQGCHQIRHDQLTVQPYLNIDARGVYQNLPSDLGAYTFEYVISNDGLGPARIEKITYVDTLTGAEYSDPRLFVRQKQIDFKSLSMWGYTGEVFLKEGDSLPLFRLQNHYLKDVGGHEEQVKQVEEIKKAFQTTKIIIDYESLLEETKQATWKPG